MPPQLVYEGNSELRSAISKKCLILGSSLLSAHKSAITQSYCHLLSRPELHVFLPRMTPADEP